jgi:asparagine synthase (glutamine-hydrolysing)
MNGVFGVASSNRADGIADLAERLRNDLSSNKRTVIEHFTDCGAGVALGRRSIGIFNSQSQPLWNRDHTVALVMAGELYKSNPSQARQLQVRHEEDALSLYEELGEAFVSRLNGAFSLAIWDSPRQKLVLANDRFGLYPVYYSHSSGRFAFAPEVKALLNVSQVERRLDVTALSEYVRFQQLLGDKTFFEGIALLPNACTAVYDLHQSSLKIRPYWDFDEIPTLPRGLRFDEAVEEAGRLLKRAVDMRMDGTHRVGVYLSGGVDSRVLLGMIGREAMPVPSVTYGLRSCRDVVYASAVAHTMHTDHHSFEFQDGEWVRQYASLHLELTEGFHSWIHAHGISILDQTKDVMDVNLTGLHGQELNWEDPALFAAPDEAAFANRLFWALTRDTTWPSIDEAEEAELYTPELSKQLCGRALQSLHQEVAKLDYLPASLRALAFSCATDRRLFQYYTVFSRSQVEQRFPFYDYDYFDFVHALPLEMIAGRRLRKAVIYTYLPHLAGIPYDKDDLPITRSRVEHLAAKASRAARAAINKHVGPVFPVRGSLHSDYEGWLRAELRSWGEDLLISPRARSRGLFRPEAVESLWNRHQSGLEPNFVGKIAPLMTIEMLLRRFLDRTEPASLQDRVAVV